jgi:hypothetical protein
MSKSGPIWKFVKRTGLLPSLGLQSQGHKGTVKGLLASGAKGLEPITYQSIKVNNWYGCVKGVFFFVLVAHGGCRGYS